MDLKSSGGGGGILQLHKWEEDTSPLDLSEFQQAFISPTTQILLLLSYHSQALLLPLPNNGKSVDCTGDYVPSSSEYGKADPSADFFPPMKSSRFNSNSFVWDVNSLAWGICGDSYDRHEDSPFTEFLFVCGSHGVTVHGFCKPKSSSEIDNHIVTGEIGEGNWRKWGPSTTSNVENSDGSPLDVGDNESEKNIDPKRWLRTFLTKAETMKSDGIVWTRYPAKSSYPSSATVVSFDIFDGTSPDLDFFPYSSLLSKNEGCDEPNSVEANNTLKTPGLSSSGKLLETNVDPNLLSGRMTSSYQCSKVFSSLSHNLIGFVLIFSSDNEENSQVLLLVTKIVSCGIQWIFSVKLDESVNGGISMDWSDFGFSDNCLICLSKGGKIFFHDIMTGEYVANVNIAHICGLHHQLIPKEQDKMLEEDDLVATGITQNNQDGVNGSTCYAGDLFSKRTFRRLLISSHTSVLAVIDGYGVIYVIDAADHIPAKYHTYEKQLPHCQHLGLGLNIGWEIGGVDIGHQRILSHFSDYSRGTSNSSRSIFSINSVNTCRVQDRFLEKKGMHCDSFNSGFSAASTLINDKFSSDDISLRLARKVFLPSNKSSEDDVICFSSFGVTRLIKAKKNGGSQILHSSLYVDSAGDVDVSDDIRGWETVIEESVGCSFGGCLYLVTESGISVVLPSVSVSPNILPVEVIEYPNSFTGVTADHHIGDLFQARDTKQPWSPWKLEVLDRALLHEGPEEVNRLCSENGWDLKIPRIRCLQLALYYLHFDEVEKSLESLVGVLLAEDGVLRLVFAAVFLMSYKHASDIEVSAASRLLTLATRFATKMIRKYGMVQHQEDTFLSLGHSATEDFHPPSILQHQEEDRGSLIRLQEMSRFLVIIRKLQCRLSAKYKRPGHGRVEGAGVLSSGPSNFQQDNLEPSVILAGALSFDRTNQTELSAVAYNADFGNALAIMPMDYCNSKSPSNLATGLPVILSDGKPSGRKSFPLENPKDMINRWERDNLDLKTIVKDALHSGRLPLAVLQLHLRGARELATKKEPHDTFNDVRMLEEPLLMTYFLRVKLNLL